MPKPLPALIFLLLPLLAACAARSSVLPTLAAGVTEDSAAAVLQPVAAASPTPAPTASASPDPTLTPVPPTTTSSPPLPAPSATATPPTIRLLFTGDINPGRCPAQRSLRANDFTLPYQKVAEVLRAADLTIGSLDGTLSDASPPSPCPKTLNLIGPSRTVEGLAFAGFDVITVATNHAKDCGTLGWGCGNLSFHDTQRHLSAAGLRAVGGGETLAEALAPLVVEVQDVRFAFIGVTSVGMETWARDDRPGTAPLSDALLPRVVAAIRAARERADVVIVLAQWGVEYTLRPDDTQWRWAPLLIGAGADLVIGNHPHLVQPVEVFEARDGVPGGVVAYALGNFVFDQGPWETRQGVVFEAVFTGRALTAWRLLPVHIYSLHQPNWAPPDEAAEILDRVSAASAALPER
jgi:poly-gamma-glutamate synthesis protein (capsule biosynthesis protein)